MTNHNMEPAVPAPGEYDDSRISDEALGSSQLREYGPRDRRPGAVRGVGRFAIGEFPLSWREQPQRDIDPGHFDTAPQSE